MINQLIPLGDKNVKVFGFTEEKIILSSKRHKSFESLLEGAVKPGLIETVTVVPMGSVRELGYNEKDKTFDIKYDKGGKNKKVSVLLDDISLREAIVEEIAALKEMQKEVKEESKTQPLLYNLLGVVLIPVFTWVMRDMAIDAQNGEHYVASGRKSGAKQLVANLVETIGPMGVTLIGIAGLAFMIYKTYNRYQNPAAEIQYQLK